MQPVALAVDQVLLHHPPQVSLVDDQDPVQEFSAKRADHPLADRVRARRLRWPLDDLDALGGEDGVECGSEQGVSVADEEPQGLDSFTQVEQEVAGLLSYPFPGRVGGHPGQVHPPVGHLHDDKDVQAPQQHRLHGEEVAADDAAGLGGQELPPAGPVPPLRRIDAGPAQAAGWLQAVMYGRPDRRKLTIIDEGWAALDDLAIVRFLQDQWRLGRQWGCANILITHALLPALPPFQALWKIGAQTALVEHHIDDEEWSFCDTDAAMMATPTHGSLPSLKQPV
jgi:hypothetical protein